MGDGGTQPTQDVAGLHCDSVGSPLHHLLPINDSTHLTHQGLLALPLGQPVSIVEHGQVPSVHVLQQDLWKDLCANVLPSPSSSHLNLRSQNPETQT